MFTNAERLILWNQYEILKRLDPDNSRDHETNQHILASGYERYYGQLNPSIDTDVLPGSVLEEVEEILDMFRTIEFSPKRLEYTPKSTFAAFEGFDGNAYEGHYGVGRFLRRVQGKWEELKDRPDNSHTGMSLPIYRRMLVNWHRLGRKFDLTPEEIEEIADRKD